MRLLFNIRPTKLVAPTKQAVINLATPRHAMTSGSGNKISYTGYKTLGRSSNDNTIIVMNLHKVRKSVIQEKGKDGKTKSKVTSKAHWVAYVYTFDLSVLSAMGIRKVSQNSRNFTISK